MDQNKELEKRLKRLKEDYKIIFGSEEGQRVLEDISIRCHERTTTFSKDNSHETAFLKDKDQFFCSSKQCLNQNNQ